MLKTSSQYLIRIKAFFIFLFLSLITFPAYSQGTDSNSTFPSALDMLKSFAKDIPNLMSLVTAIAYVMGIFFIISGIIKLKHFGEARTMMSHEHSVVGPILYLVIGSLLIYLPTAVQIGLSTFWTDPNPYAYVQEQQDQWSQFMNIIYLVVQLIGTIALIRGLVIMSHLGGQSGQNNFARGLIHIIAGIGCINIYGVIKVVMATFGISQ